MKNPAEPRAFYLYRHTCQNTGGDRGIVIPTRFTRGPLSTRKIQTSLSLVFINLRLRTPGN